MRVCLDCFPFLVSSAGWKMYLFHLQRNLRRIAPHGSISSFPFLDGVETIRHNKSVLGPAATAWRFAVLLFANTDHNPVLDLLGRRIDLFHASNQVRNPPRNAKLTTTVQDLTTQTHPELHTPANVANDIRWLDRIVRRADGIIVPSTSTRDDAVRMLNLPPDRLKVILHGVNDEYFDPSPAQIDAALQALGIAKPYILFVSTIEPRKNLDRLLDAYEQLPSGLREEFDFLICGPRGWRGENTMLRLDAKPPGIRALGYVPEELMPGLTAGATVFAYPSLYEGFGFPVAQAMAAGVPVLTSNVSSLPEVAGGAAALIDPFSTTEIRDGLKRLLLSPSLRERMAAQGRARASELTWERCARETWRFFEQV